MMANHFEALSPEIRLIIYRDVFNQSSPTRVSDDNASLNVLRTCRMFRQEATEVYYQESTFLVTDPISALMWLPRVEPYARHVRRIQLEVDISPIEQDQWEIMGHERENEPAFDEQWKSVVSMIGSCFERLESLGLVVVARRLQEIHPNAAPRPHRYLNLFDELFKFQHAEPLSCLAELQRSCPRFRSLSIASPFHIESEVLTGSGLNLVVAAKSSDDGLTWYKLGEVDNEKRPQGMDQSDSDESDSDEGM